MKDIKTYLRRDIMNEFHISRRVIEGYEEIGLVKPTLKNSMGTYLYDEKAFKRIGFIRLCQKMGFKVKEVKEFIDKPNEEVKRKLNLQAEEIRRSIKTKNQLLKITCTLASSDNPKESNKIFEIFKEENI